VLLAPCADARRAIKGLRDAMNAIDEALPPGEEDELYCPEGTCLGPKEVEDGMTGPRTMFVECRHLDGEMEPELVTGWGVNKGQDMKDGLLGDGFHMNRCEETGDEDVEGDEDNLNEEMVDQNLDVDDENLEEEISSPVKELPTATEDLPEPDEILGGHEPDQVEIDEEELSTKDAVTQTEDIDSEATVNGKVSIDNEELDLAVEDEVAVEEGPKGMRLTIEGFPEDIDGVHRGALNGVYSQDLTGNCVQGHPTYWKDGDADDTPFIYFCKTNSTTKLWHQKWAISSKKAFAKVQTGVCETFAPFPAKTELASGLAVTAVHQGWVDGENKGWATADKQEWVKNVRIAVMEPMDAAPTVDCKSA